MKQKPKQIAAIICIVLLVLLYVATLVMSLLDFPGLFFYGFISGFMASTQGEKPWLRMPRRRNQGKKKMAGNRTAFLQI